MEDWKISAPAQAQALHRNKKLVATMIVERQKYF